MYLCSSTLEFHMAVVVNFFVSSGNPGDLNVGPHACMVSLSTELTP